MLNSDNSPIFICKSKRRAQENCPILKKKDDTLNENRRKGTNRKTRYESWRTKEIK